VTTARRYRVDVEKLQVQDKVAAEFAAQRSKQNKSKMGAKKSAVA